MTVPDYTRIISLNAAPESFAQIPQVQAMLAAKLEEAADPANLLMGLRKEAVHPALLASLQENLRALITPDMAQALADRDALVRREVLERAKVATSDDDFFELVVDALAEADRAMRKFPQPNYVISKVAEEAGEVVKAAIHCAEGRETAESVRGEMRQLIAMLYRLWVEGDQVHGLAAIRADGGK